VIALACDEHGVVAVDVAEGQRNDAPLAEAVLIEARDADRGSARSWATRASIPRRSATSGWTTSTPCR